MTENETIKEFNKMVGDRMKTKRGISEKQHGLFQIAMDSLEEIQQYRAIGTVEECREAKEKQRAKKPIKQKCDPTDDEVQELVDLGFVGGDVLRCPCCNDFIVIKDLKHCMECGQKLDWSDTD